MADLPIWSDIIDEGTIVNGQRQEGLYQGIITFFVRLAIAAQVIIFFLIHTLSGYVPSAPSQSPDAMLGLRIQISLVPLILMVISSFIFLKFYDLTPQKIEEIKGEMMKANI